LKKILFIALVVVLALSVGLIGCEGEGEPTQYIKIGHVSSLNGMYAGFGAGALFGIEAAIDDINAAGGVTVDGTNYELELYTRESNSDESAVASHTEYLIDTNGVHGIVGAFIPPPMAAPQVPIVETAGIPLLQTPGPYEPWMDMTSAFNATYTFTTTFRIATPVDPPTPGYLIKDIGFDFHDALGVDNTTQIVGVFASDDGDGAGWFALMGQMLEDAGYTTSTWDGGTGIGKFAMATSDYSPIFDQWIADNVTAIWGNCPPPHFIDLWTQAYAAGFEPEIIFAARAGLFWQDMDTLPDDLAVGIGLESWWHNAYDPGLCPGVGTTTPQSLFDDWVADTGQPLNPNIGWGYANVQILVDAIEDADSLVGDDIRAALLAGSFDTIAGPIDYDAADLNCPVPLHYFQWFEDGDTIKPEVVVSHHAFLATTDTAFLKTYP
jgi:branched-chain amino acid transport system substrate-binding protein